MIAAALLAAAAWSSVEKRVCIAWDPQLWPAGLAAGDRWTSPGTHPALGVWARVASPGDPEDRGEFTPWDGDRPGCLVAQLEPGGEYELQIRYEARVNGVLLEAFSNRTADERESEGTLPLASLGRVDASSSDPQSFVAADPHRAPLLAIGGLMMSLDNFGLDRPDPGQEASLRFYPDLGKYDEKARWLPLFPTTWGTMHGWPTRQKFLIAHEIGHMIATIRDEGKDTSTDIPGCPGWTQRSADGRYLPDEQHCRADVDADPAKGLMSMEYQAMAAREGWADFVAAWTWNRTSDADCVYGEWGNVKDVDLDGTADNRFGNPKLDGWLSCVGVPLSPDLCRAWGTHCAALRPYVGTRDWLEDVAKGDDPAGCDPASLVNRGTSFDWMRFWWAMASTERVPVRDLANLLDNMNLRTADPDDDRDPDRDCGLPGKSDDVTVRLVAAAARTRCGASPSCTAAVAAERDHGQDH